MAIASFCCALRQFQRGLSNAVQNGAPKSDDRKPDVRDVWPKSRHTHIADTKLRPNIVPAVGSQPVKSPRQLPPFEIFGLLEPASTMGISMPYPTEAANAVSLTRDRLAGFTSVVAFVGVLLLSNAGLAEEVQSVATPGSGVLTMCRNWVVYNSCDTRKVALPVRIRVGDQIKLTYGSNLKQYLFHVIQIREAGAGCAILSDASGGREDGEKLEVSPCRATAEASP